MASVPQPSIGAARQDLYRRMDKHNLAPLWEVLHNLIPNEPVTPCKPALWKYRDARPYLMEAGKLITAKEAIRRVLILENPGMRGESCITQSLYAGLQLILPGEIAPSHRHSQSALRFIVEGTGAYTAVDGERTTMQPGRLHHHAVVDLARPRQPRQRAGGVDGRPRHPHRADLRRAVPRGVPGGSAAGVAQRRRVGRALRQRPGAARRGGAVRQDLADLQLSLRAQPRGAGAACAKDQDPDACHGWKMEFINPLTGGHAMPTIAAFIQLLPKGFRTQPYRSHRRHDLLGGRGQGHARASAARASTSSRATPSSCRPGCRCELEANGETVLFSFSDRPGQEAMGLWREKRG